MLDERDEARLLSAFDEWSAGVRDRLRGDLGALAARLDAAEIHLGALAELVLELARRQAAGGKGRGKRRGKKRDKRRRRK